MPTLQDYDGLLLSFNDKFLTNLIGERYELSKIRFKFLSIQRNPMYRTFATYQDFYTYFSSILTDPRRICITGRFPVIESIDIVNESLNFPNTYHVRNVTTGANIQLDFKFDSLRRKTQENQVKTYQKYLNRKFTNYLKDVSTLTTIRKQNYIDSCWIDPEFFEGDTIQLLTV
tara:strand:- start:73 stop:591 length:519 start_codon:yes stop_codon:yes gene_type:complete